MKKLIDYAKILRSKNAGPLFMTFDIIFPDEKSFLKIEGALTREMVAEAYGIEKEQIEIISYAVVNSIKITFPRKHISGSLLDNDIYGCQQHMPLANIEICDN